MSGILQLLSAISPAPVGPITEDYEGLKYDWKMFTFRPAYFKTEAIAFSALGAYLLWFYLGQYFNASRANAIIKSLKPFIDSQFMRSRDLVSSGPAQHLLYSTGRRNALGLHTTLILYPIHDLISLILHIGKTIVDPTYDGGEYIVFNLTLGAGTDGRQGEGLGVWALSDKGLMRQIREKRWDLTFPRLSENPLVPVTHALFTEHSDISDALLKTANVGITDLLSDKQAASILKYLVITDQPAVRPGKGPLPAKLKRREIVLAVHKPGNKQQTAAVQAWLQVILNIADLLDKPNLIRQDVARKLIKTREQVDTDLGADYTKYRVEELGELSKEEQAEEKRLAKKKAERAKLSEKELKRIEELEKKREIRKMQKKQAMGGAR